MAVKEKKNKEILYHHKFLTWLDNVKINYDTWGSSGPDVLFDDFSVLGEFKIDESKTSYKNALIEIQKRTKPEFNIKNFKYFFILTKDYIRVYKTDSIDWDAADFKTYATSFDYINKSQAVFKNAEENRESFIDYIENNCNKISVDAHMDEVLDLLLSEQLDLTVMDAIIIISNLNQTPIFLKNAIVYNAGEDNEYTISFKSKSTLEDVKKRLINKYYINDFKNVRDYIKHNYSSHLPDTKKSNLGKYYTPKFIVEIMKEKIDKYITPNTYVLDLACGCGAFLEIFDDCHTYGRDIDQNAIDVLSILGIPNIAQDNSLVNVSRDKYKISTDDNIIIIGNPPYNDVTAKNKRFGTNAKSETGIEIDADISSNDLGQCFLKAYSKLDPEYICVLHPLSYLIKPTNFKSLNIFTRKYKLKEATIFSSSNFPDLKGNTEFPIIIALYEKGEMDFDYISNFNFDILNNTKKFKLSDFETIDKIIDGKKYINKYPIKKDSKHIQKSDIDLYQYNIRDTNSLMSSGNLMYIATTDNLNYVTVDFKDLYKYCYLNMYRTFFKNHYLIGNLSPLININEYENNKELQDLMIIGTILKNKHRIKCFDYTDKQSIIFTKFLLADYKKKAKTYTSGLNFYQLFIDIINNENIEKESMILNLISDYFQKLYNKYL